jgi:hypothetical protein
MFEASRKSGKTLCDKIRESVPAQSAHFNSSAVLKRKQTNDWSFANTFLFSIPLKNPNTCTFIELSLTLYKRIIESPMVQEN